MIGSIDQILAEVKAHIKEMSPEDDRSEQLFFHVYGKNGVMGALEPFPNPAHELCLIIDVVASTQDVADTICSFTRSTLLHYGYPNRKSTAGNLAFPYSPSDISVGAVYRFNIYHLLEVDNPTSLFPLYIRRTTL